ncbi:hypothetical protein DDZ16_10440 [Marinilabilia rubra]|uniref:Uncharacterized protein n=1 Tax=Marinilabilia rubra TaxID=2162893 RepID=A0A2U2B8M5_9BACT|nr:hypothetical protein DDZ16_10440 [Marinilabilia rubra]
MERYYSLMITNGEKKTQNRFIQISYWNNIIFLKEPYNWLSSYDLSSIYWPPKILAEYFRGL